MGDAVYFQFDTRSGDYQYGPDGRVQYSNVPAWMGTVTVSTGDTTVKGWVIPRGMQIWTVGTSTYYDIVAGGASGGSFVSIYTGSDLFSLRAQHTAVLVAGGGVVLGNLRVLS